MKIKRIENDFYETPGYVTEQLTRLVYFNGTVLDPCYGNGALIRDLKDCDIVTNDFYSSADYKLDATTLASWREFPKFDWCVVNPPFNKAHEILPLGFQFAERGLCALVRLTYLEPCITRRQFLKEHSDCLKWAIFFSPRIRFRKDTKTTDSATVCWLVWDKKFSWDMQGMHCPFNFVTP